MVSISVKRLKLLVLMLLTTALISCGGGEPEEKPNTEPQIQKQQAAVLEFADQKLVDCFNETIEANGYSAVSEITKLECPGREIQNIEGIESLTYLQELDLSNNNIKDIGYLDQLPNLVTVNLENNQIRLLDAVEDSKTIETINLANNPDILCEESMVAKEKLGEKLTVDEECTEGLHTVELTIFADANLDACVKSQSQEMGAVKLEQIARLRCVDKQIESIEGLELLINLRELELTKNQITQLEPLANLTSINKLLLANNQIADVTPLTSLTYITELWLNQNQIESLQGLETLNNIQLLHLSDNNIREIEQLQNLSRIKELRISNNRLIDIEEVGTLTTLRGIWLDGNQIADITPVTKITELNRLWLSDNWFVDAAEMAKLTKLKWLHLDNTLIEDNSPLNGLTSLEWLQLENTRISSIASLYPLTKLKWLHLKGNNDLPCPELDRMEDIIGEAAIDRPESCNQPPEMHSAAISTIEFTDDSLRDCIYDAAGQSGQTDIDQITEVNCSGSQIEDTTGLEQLTELETVDLSENQVSCEQQMELAYRLGKEQTNPTPECIQQLTIGGTVTGLKGTLTLQNNQSDDLELTQDGTFAFVTTLEDISSYSVVITQQPQSPMQICEITNTTGTAQRENVTNIAISCTTNQYSIGGTVTGLQGSGLILQNNAGNDIAIDVDGAFIFTQKLDDLSSYNVIVKQQPNTPAQICTVTNAVGNLAAQDINNVAINCTTNQYSIGGTVTGLQGSGLILQNNAGDDLAVGTDGIFTFTQMLNDLSSYNITVKQQPNTPAQNCTVTNVTGSIAAQNVTNIAINCTTNQYSIGGTVTGLQGSELILQNNAGDDLAISAYGTFTFTAKLDDQSPYAVTVLTNPEAPAQTCSVTNATGSLAALDVSNVAITCATNQYSIGGTVTGLQGSELILQNNAGDDLAISADGVFTFTTKLDDQSAYAVTVLTNPSSPAQTCAVASATGNLAAQNVTNVAITCTTNQYSIGGTVTGLQGSGLILQNNAGDDLAISSDGIFTFTTKLDDQSPYAVTVLTNPEAPAQTCSVTNATGSLAALDVTDIAITCITNQYSIGGAVAGLKGSVTLQLNGSEQQTITSDGTFTFTNKIEDQKTYAVEITQTPETQNCEITNNAGTVNAGDVTIITVTCADLHKVSVAVTGLEGTGLKVTNNGQDQLDVAENGTYDFSNSIKNGEQYNVTVASQPQSPAQACSVTNATGTIDAQDVIVNITCESNRYSIGGTITGLKGSGFVIQNNNGDDLVIEADGNFTFAATMQEQDTYEIVVLKQPITPVQTCEITNDAGAVATNNITDIQINCTTSQFTIGGTVSGLIGTGLVIQNNGGDDLTITENGSFSFATPLEDAASYEVIISNPAQDPIQYCYLENGSGTLNGENIVNVFLICELPNDNEDFERGKFDVFYWKNTGIPDYKWHVSSEGALDGNYSATTPRYFEGGPGSTEMSMTVVVPQDTIMSFDLKTDNGDHINLNYLHFYIDSSSIQSWNGNTENTKFEYFISAGRHTFKWIYVFNHNGQEGKAWIDNIYIPGVSRGADTDADGIPDMWEYTYFGTLDHDMDLDTDSDGLTDGQERDLDLDPFVVDTDGDGMLDGWEVEHDLDPKVDDIELDLDGDGTTNYVEYVIGTDPEVVDVVVTDYGFEQGVFDLYYWNHPTVSHWMISAEQPIRGEYSASTPDYVDGGGDYVDLVVKADIAQDSLISFHLKTESTYVGASDYNCLYLYIDGGSKNSWCGNTDAMEYEYYISSGIHEIKWRYYIKHGDYVGKAWLDNVYIPGVTRSTDIDADGYSDMWELTYFGDLEHDMDLDTDFDGLLDSQEGEKGLDPYIADTDSDGMPDKWEYDYGLNGNGYNPMEDPDGDDAPNFVEYLQSSDPNAEDALPLGFGYEQGLFDIYQWIRSGDGNWIVDDQNPLQGTYSAKTMDNQDGASNLAVTANTVAGRIGFNLETYSLNEADELKFIIDGVVKGNWTAETGFTQVEYNIPEGEHIFEWEYQCQAPCDGNAWIDDVFIPVTFDTGIAIIPQ